MGNQHSGKFEMHQLILNSGIHLAPSLYYGISTSSRVAEGDRTEGTKTSNPYANRGVAYK